MRISKVNVLKQLNKMVVKAILLCSATATAAIPPMVYPIVEERGASIPLDLDQIARLDLMFQNEKKSFDLTQYVPTKQIHEGMNEQDFAEVILKTSLERFLDGQSDSSTLKTIDRAARGFSSQELKIGSNGSKNQTVKFRLDPLDAQTKIIYRGVASAEVSYDLDDKILKVEVSNRVGIATVVASHIDNSGDRSDTVGVRWDF